MTDAQWKKAVADKLVGKPIKSVSFMTQAEEDEWGGSKRPLQITLSDGHQLLISQDDEGNNGGSIFTTYEALPVIPVL